MLEVRLNVNHSPDGSGEHWSAPSTNDAAVVARMNDKDQAEFVAAAYRKKSGCDCGCVVIVKEGEVT